MRSSLNGGQHLAGILAGTIVHQYDVQVLVRLGDHALQGARQQGGPVEEWYDHADRLIFTWQVYLLATAG